MAKKRYWWLKLREGYFDSVEMRRIRKAAGGDVYTIIYLKLQLLSLKTDGIVSGDGYDESLAEELAFAIGERTDDVTNAIAILQRYGLIESISSNSFLIPSAVENTGSETQSAVRMRRHRTSKASHCDADDF